MNDLQLLTLVADTDLYPDDAPIPETIATPDEAFANVVAWLEGEAQPGRGSTQGRRAIRPRRRTGVLVAAAMFFAVLLIGATLWLLLPPAPDVVEPTPTTVPTTVPTTTAPTTVPTTGAPTTVAPQSVGTPADDVAIAEAAIAAWYANDFDTFSQLVDMPGQSSHSGWTPEDFRNHMAYDAVTGGRVEATCSPPPEAGDFFTCRLPLQNSLTDALSLPLSSLVSSLQISQGTAEETMRVVDGLLTRYEFYDHQWIIESFAIYLTTIDEFTGFEECLRPPLDAACGQIQMDHLNAWTEWSTRDTATAAAIAQAHIEALFSGDCQAVLMLTTDFDAFNRSDCPDEVLYETAVGGTLELSNCTADPDLTVTCDGSYRNALGDAVEAPSVSMPIVVGVDFGEGTWGATDFQSDHPTDEALLLTFRAWAQEAGLDDAADDECGLATPRTTPRCATFLMDNLDAWAAWYVANN